MSTYVLPPAARDDMRQAFQAVYGAWVGTLVAAGRTDVEIVELLESSVPGLDYVLSAEVTPIVHRARAVILAALPTFRQRLAAAAPTTPP